MFHRMIAGILIGIEFSHLDTLDIDNVISCSLWRKRYYSMTPEERARLVIDEKLIQSGWVVQSMKELNVITAIGVAVREFPTSSGAVDYALFISGTPESIAKWVFRNLVMHKYTKPSLTYPISAAGPCD